MNETRITILTNENPMNLLTQWIEIVINFKPGYVKIHVF